MITVIGSILKSIYANLVEIVRVVNPAAKPSVIRAMNRAMTIATVITMTVIMTMHLPEIAEK